MEINGRQVKPARGGRSHLECRACPVICERVVSPVHCLRSRCRFVYVFEEEGCLFFGCVEKVFGAELDLAVYQANPRKDPYGVLKATRKPLPECLHHVERAYEYVYSRRDCSNPAFAHHPEQYSPEAVRRLVESGGLGSPPRRDGTGDTGTGDNRTDDKACSGPAG